MTGKGTDKQRKRRERREERRGGKCLRGEDDDKKRRKMTMKPNRNPPIYSALTLLNVARRTISAMVIKGELAARLGAARKDRP